MNKDEGSPAEDPNLDLYCLQCGYNLRGLSGDPRRCPECGYHNPISELTIPAKAISRTLERLETAPTLCVGAAGVLLIASFFLFLILRAGAPEAVMCPLTFFLSAVVIWIAAAARFRSTCGGHPAWATSLLKYHLYGLGAGLTGGAMIIATGLVLSRRSGAQPCGTTLVIDGGAIVAMLFFGRWARRDLKSVIDPIQRHLAVRIAREEMAKKMRRQRYV